MITDIDLLPTVRIEVTADDIAEGRRHSCERCPIALATRRALRAHPHLGFHGAFFGAIGFYTLELDSIEFLPSPEIAKHFVRDFDCGDPVAPFAFDQPIPPASAEVSPC
jgi:hypothetical protein